MASKIPSHNITGTFQLIKYSNPINSFLLQDGALYFLAGSFSNALNIPIQNDQIYPILTPYQEYDLDFSKQLKLLAKEIHFKDPISNVDRIFSSRRKLD